MKGITTMGPVKFRINCDISKFSNKRIGAGVVNVCIYFIIKINFGEIPLPSKGDCI